MKYLAYTTYCSGRSGLSNGIMSIEIGIILAFLMDRVLVLDGNVSPPANIVQYPDIINNRDPSKITELFDLPIPWMNADQVDFSRLDSKEFTSQSLGNSVFYFPHTLDLRQEDFHSFAGGRKHFLTYSDEAKEISVLTMPGGPGVGKHQYKMANFTFYSYFFYLDSPTQQKVFDLLIKMTPKQPYREFATRVIKDLGSFNAVHIRRGDFKKTYGVTTLERTPQEVLEVLDHHFRRDDPLVILTDEMSDPFFTDIRKGYPNSLFLDQFVLDNYRKEFLDLPCHDSISLAFLGQLIASGSQNFIGSMTSTYTSLIQRYRGNSGKVEPFKFLWNELAAIDVKVERGRHPVGTCVPMRHGVMIEEFKGPYSWNRYNPRINPAWMREWPESFLTREAHTKLTESAEASLSVDSAISCLSRDAAMDLDRGNGMGQQVSQELLWVQGTALVKDGRAVALIGTPSAEMSPLIRKLREGGWSTVSKDVVRLNVKTGMVHPSQQRSLQEAISCRAVIFSNHSSQLEDTLEPCSPSAAVGELLSNCVRLIKDHKESVRLLCDLILRVPVFRLSFASAKQAAELVCQAHHDQALKFHSTSKMENLTMKPAIRSHNPGSVKVQIALTGGHQFTVDLPAKSPILEELFSAMGAQGQSSSTRHPKFFQIPINGDHSICSFSSEQLVCVVTDPQGIVRSKQSIWQSDFPEVISSHFVQIDNFLTLDEKDRLLTYALQHESALTPGTTSGNLPDYRKSRVLYSFRDSEFSELLVNRVRTHLPDLLCNFDVPSYDVKEIEAQLTSSNDGDFFKIHNDNGFRDAMTRELTYVYYFYRDPKPFAGGELVLYDSKLVDNAYTRAASFKVIEPRNNSIVFFLSGCLHEVLPVRCPSEAYEDSRFTVNGWVRRQRMLPPTQLPESILEWAKDLE